MDDTEPDININDHTERCRLCLKMIVESEICFKVKESTKERFEILTSGLELSLDRIFSCLMCESCNSDFTRLWTFREDLIMKQKKLYEIVYSDIVEDHQLEEIEPEPEYLIEIPSEIQIDNDENENIETLDEEEEVLEDIEYVVSETVNFNYYEQAGKIMNYFDKIVL